MVFIQNRTEVGKVMPQGNRNLGEVSFIRPFLIVLLVLYHAMAIHTGNWPLPDGCAVIGEYKIIGRLAYSFMLETFVFLSGYVWAYQVDNKGISPLLTLVKKKFKRLIVPCWLFGILYLFLFEDFCNESLPDNIFLVLEGIGHLWFLPMLFLCFILAWVMVKMQMPKPILVAILAVLLLLSRLDLPFRLSLLFYYIFFFFAGFYMFGRRHIISTKVDIKLIFVSWGGYVVSFILFSLLRSYSVRCLPDGYICRVCMILCQLIYATFGTLSLYLTAIYNMITKGRILPQWMLNIGSCCFGVYIFQQFILKYLYYYSIFPACLPQRVMPWVAFVIALLTSLILTWTIRTTSVGRKLL